MNKARRKKIDVAKIRLDELIARIEEIRDEEQEAFDNLPESIQESSRGEQMQEAIDVLDNALSSLEEVGEYLEQAQSE